MLALGAFVLVAGTLGWCWIGAHSGSGLRLAADDPQVVLAGKAIYAARCAACHGQHLEGQPAWRQRRADGRLPAPPHDASGHTWHHDDGLLVRLTLRGPQTVAGNDYASDMPAFDKLLSERGVIASSNSGHLSQMAGDASVPPPAWLC